MAADPVIIIEGVEDPGPFLTIRVLCRACGEELISRTIDSRTTDARDAAGTYGDADAHAALAHVCR
jgi:hypothetical protein